MKLKFISVIAFCWLILTTGCQANLENQASSYNAGASRSTSSEEEDFALDRNGLNDISWFRTMYDAYEPEQSAISALSQRKENLRFVVFGGSWCPDTRKALPKFYKVVEQAGVSPEKIQLYGVDHEKKSQERPVKGKRKSDEFNISRVPEFVVFYDGKEVGRLNEKPGKSLEEDMVVLIEKL